MKKYLPLMAVVAATLSTPVMAQSIDTSRFAGINALMAEMGGRAVDLRAINSMPHALGLRAPVVAAPDHVAAISLAPRTSLMPIPRRGTTVVAPVHAQIASAERTPELARIMADVAEVAPAGANTFVVNGTNTAVIHSSPTVTTARPSLWQRLFGG